MCGVEANPASWPRLVLSGVPIRERLRGDGRCWAIVVGRQSVRRGQNVDIEFLRQATPENRRPRHHSRKDDRASTVHDERQCNCRHGQNACDPETQFAFPGEYEGFRQQLLELFIACHSSRFISRVIRSEEHTSELQSLMRISYAVFCLKKKKNTK